MKQLKIYGIGIISILILLFLCPTKEGNKLKKSKDEEFIKTQFLSSYANYANQRSIEVEMLVNTKQKWLFEEADDKNRPWIAKDGTLYYPVQQFKQLLKGNVLFYPNKTVQIKQGERSILYSEKEIQYRKEIPYLPLEKILEDFGYEMQWNRATNTIKILGNSKDALPVKFDLREEGRVTKVRDQGRYGTCWAFGALGAMESRLLPEENFQFSVDHMTQHSGFYLTEEEGGEYHMSIAYLASWRGPVLEEDDPYGDGYSPKYLVPVKHLQEAILLPSKDYEAIKRAVFLYGGVETNIFTSLKSATSWSQYYNQETYAYYFNGNLAPNHDVIIVGWDDEYPKENFTKTPPNDGAFLCKNSWGTAFGEEGYFYISYYDSVVGTNNIVYTKIEDTKNYDNIYETDELGWVGQMGYGKEDAWFANVYTAKGEETLKAVSFYATMPNTTYEVYEVEKFHTEDSLQERKKVAEGSFEQAGYYTVSLDEEIPLKKGQKYAVIVKIHTPGSKQPVAIEYKRDIRTSTFTVGDGEGYISLHGIDWTRTEKKQMSNVCLKAFTSNQKQE